MTATIRCSPTEKNPTHHIKLTDGVSSVGLVLRSGNRIDPRAISRRPRQNGMYSPFTQSDWGSGRGIKDAGSDRSRFADSGRVITRHSGNVMLSSQETYTTGYRDAEKYLPGKMSWVSLLLNDRYIAYKFTASASTNRESVYLWVRRRGTPTSTLTVELCSDNSGNPGTVLKTVTKTTTDITDTLSQLFEFAFSSVQAVTSGTSYWIKVYTSTADSSTNYWQVGTDAARTNSLTKASAAGSDWATYTPTYDLYWRIVDDTDQLGGLFFNYKGQLYFVTRPSGSSAPKLYINGDRGVATGTQSTTTIQDTTKSWTTNAFAGATVMVVGGTNSEWETPYRIITSNTSNTLTFPAFPKASVAGDTQYIIIGANTWTEITGHGMTVLPTSVASSGEICYFAFGDFSPIRRMREYISNAVWTREFASEFLNFAKFISNYRHPSKGLLICKVNDYNNIGLPAFAFSKSPAWGRWLEYPFLVNDCEATTGWVTGTNGAVAVDNTDFRTKTKSLKLTISGSPGNPILYYPITVISNMNATFLDSIRFWIKSSANVNKGVVKVFLSTSATAASQIELLEVPALAAGEWTQVVLPYNKTTAGVNSVLSIGFQTTATSGNFWFDGIELYAQGTEVLLGNVGEKITGLENYGDPETPWVFRTQSAGSVENGIFSPIPLKELSQAESIHNGVGHVVHNVYLYFSFLHGIERFYRNNLDDVGPNRDEGIPDGRRGYISSMVGYIGRFFYNIDSPDGFSCIMESASGTDHHEVYRSSTAGKRIRNLFVQVVPGDAADRLWFTEGDDIAWIPLPGNTLKEDTDDTFRFTHEGYLETGWIYGSEQDAVKLYHNVKMFTENLTSNRKIEWDYKKNEETTWTPVSTAFTQSPVQEITLEVAAKRIKFRFRLQTNDNTITPVMRTIFVSATTRPETRWTYSFKTLFEDFPQDLQGNQDTSTLADDIITQLDTWMEANTILTMYSLFTPYNGKQVMLEPVVVQPLSLLADESNEKLLGDVVLIEP